jgi:hypothetical protein
MGPLALLVRGRAPFLAEHTPAVNVLDRLLHHASIVITAGESQQRGDGYEKWFPGTCWS